MLLSLKTACTDESGWWETDQIKGKALLSIHATLQDQCWPPVSSTVVYYSIHWDNHSWGWTGNLSPFVWLFCFQHFWLWSIVWGCPAVVLGLITSHLSLWNLKPHIAPKIIKKKKNPFTFTHTKEVNRKTGKVITDCSQTKWSVIMFCLAPFVIKEMHSKTQIFFTYKRGKLIKIKK